METSKNYTHIYYKIFHNEAVLKKELLNIVKNTLPYKRYEFEMIKHGKIKISKYCKKCIYKVKDKKYCKPYTIDQTNNKKYCKYKRRTK